tara:strand:+ start:165 stop:1841 length:1677 start_codon:yes stop_codon:yes gene_type:complete
MEKLIDYVSKIPRTTIVDFLGQGVVKGIQEFDIGLKRSDLSKILCELKGTSIFEEKGLVKSIIYHLNNNDLDTFNKSFENLKNIDDYEVYRHSLLENKWGKNRFSKSLLSFLDLDEKEYLYKEPYISVEHEIIIPRISDSEKTFLNQKIEIPEMYPLHDYQKGVKDKIVDKLHKSGERFLVHMPTGAGKTKTAVEALIDFWRIYGKDDGFMIWITERKELCEQAYETMKETWIAKGDYPINLYKIFGENEPHINSFSSGMAFIGFDKFHSLINNNSPLFVKLRDESKLIVVDEAHRSIAPTYKNIIDQLTSLKDIRLIGLTATPGRTSNQKNDQNLMLSLFFNSQKIDITDKNGLKIDSVIKHLQNGEYLAKINRIPIITNIPISDKDRRNIIKNNKLSADYISKLSIDAKRNLKIISEIEEAVLVRKDPTLVFSTNIEHAILLKVLLSDRAIRSECVFGNTPPKDRENYIRQFKKNDLPVLINFEVLREGFDAPNIKTLIIARPTLSIVLYSQMFGRALRGPKMGGKSKMNTIVDLDDNYRQLGSVKYAFKFFDSYY